jgi:predicted nucleic acid-binding Zn ribbon protein
MDALNRVIKKILNSNPDLRRGLNEARVLELWPQAVGAQIAKHAKALKLQDKRLMISVDHAVWKQELMSNKRMVLDKFNATLAEILGPTHDESPYVVEIFIVNPSRVVKAFPKKSQPK